MKATLVNEKVMFDGLPPTFFLNDGRMVQLSIYDWIMTEEGQRVLISEAFEDGLQKSQTLFGTWFVSGEQMSSDALLELVKSVGAYVDNRKIVVEDSHGNL